MNKIMSGVIITILLLITTGCFNSGQKLDCTFSLKEGKDNINEKVSLNLKDEKVTTMKRTITYDLSKYDKQAKKDYFNQIKNAFAQFESNGFTSTTELKDNILTVEINIGFDEVGEIELKNYSENYVELKTKTFTIDKLKKKLEGLKYKCS